MPGLLDVRTAWFRAPGLLVLGITFSGGGRLHIRGDPASVPLADAAIGLWRAWWDANAAAS
jgi:hypothetical protein